MSLPKETIELLERVREANPFYFEALMKSAELIPPRVKKYSPGANPFVNFETAARIMGASTTDCFRWYQALKFARLLESTEDAPDESYMDTLKDLANYALLELGYAIKSKKKP